MMPIDISMRLYGVNATENPCINDAISSTLAFQPLVPRKFSLFGRDRGHFFSSVKLGRTGPRVGIGQLQLYLSSSPEARAPC
jgi:hypothetical protein